MNSKVAKLNEMVHLPQSKIIAVSLQAFHRLNKLQPGFDLRSHHIKDPSDLVRYSLCGFFYGSAGLVPREANFGAVDGNGSSKD
jgi:hypothetical protein